MPIYTGIYLLCTLYVYLYYVSIVLIVPCTLYEYIVLLYYVQVHSRATRYKSIHIVALLALPVRYVCMMYLFIVYNCRMYTPLHVFHGNTCSLLYLKNVTPSNSPISYSPDIDDKNKGMLLCSAQCAVCTVQCACLDSEL